MLCYYFLFFPSTASNKQVETISDVPVLPLSRCDTVSTFESTKR